ncbi:MAG: hypothetical protein ACHQC8_01755 [Solirubrobacterales bacterium]
MAILNVSRILLTPLVVLLLAAVGVTIALAGSNGAGGPVTKSEAIAFARAVNLQASDLAGAKKVEPPSYEVARDEHEAAASWSRTLKCARPGIVVHRPIDVEPSVLAGTPWVVGSAVRVMPSEAIAAAEVAAFASRRGHVCFARAADVQITSENAPLGPYPVTATFIPLTRLLGSGAIDVHALIRESFRGKHWFLHSDAVLFRVGRAGIAFSVVGKTPFPVATEERLLSVLHGRAEAHKL